MPAISTGTWSHEIRGNRSPGSQVFKTMSRLPSLERLNLGKHAHELLFVQPKINNNQQQCETEIVMLMHAMNSSPTVPASMPTFSKPVEKTSLQDNNTISKPTGQISLSLSGYDDHLSFPTQHLVYYFREHIRTFDHNIDRDLNNSPVLR
jgi:hypothetical protein